MKKLIAITTLIASTLLCATVPQVAIAKPDYKHLYKWYLQNHQDDPVPASVITDANYADLNGDGTPELIMFAPFASADDWILTIYKGKVYATNYKGRTCLKYVKGKNKIYLSGDVPEVGVTQTDEFYKLEKGDLKLISDGECVNGKYSWNGKRVSKKTYKNKVKKAKGKNKFTNPYNERTSVNPSKWV